MNEKSESRTVRTFPHSYANPEGVLPVREAPPIRAIVGNAPSYCPSCQTGLSETIRDRGA